MFGESLVPQKNLGFIGFVLICLLTLITSTVVVAFHRTFIMSIDDVNKTAVFRLSSREFKFIGWYFVIFFFVVIIMVLIGLFFTGVLKEVAPSSIPVNIIGSPVYYLIARWLLVIPAASVDDVDTSIASAWNLSKGNGWRLVVLVFVLPLIMNTISLFLFSQDMLILSIIASVLYLVSLVVGIGVISLSYSYLKLKQNPITE